MSENPFGGSGAFGDEGPFGAPFPGGTPHPVVVTPAARIVYVIEENRVAVSPSSVDGIALVGEVRTIDAASEDRIVYPQRFAL